MGLMDKLKEILFDEVTVEIPVITKEESKQQEEKPKEKPITREKKKENANDEVIIKKIESTPISDDELFDMPKLKEEAREEVHTSTFTFPVFDDDDLDIKTEEKRANKKREEKPLKEESYKRKNTYKDYDYLSSTDAKSSSRSKYSSVTSEKEEKKPFTLSPIISPVYGILNENYKKEDIVTKSSTTSSVTNTSNKIDLDSVRRKAYGTLEDEIENSLGNDVLSEPPTKDDALDTLSDDGISISDLLIDDNDEIIPGNRNEEIFNQDVIEAPPEIDIDGEEDAKEEKEAIGEDDLFDLIDSLYEGKEKEE